MTSFIPRGVVVCLASAAIAACAAPVAPPPSVAVSVVREVAVVPPPGPGWSRVARSDAPGNVQQEEFVPTGQTNLEWSEKITSQPLPARVSSRDVVARLLTTLTSICARFEVLERNDRAPPTATGADRQPPIGQNDFDALVVCEAPDRAKAPSVPLKRYEVVWFRGLSGRYGDYLVQRAWHGDTVPPNAILASSAVRDDWRRWVQSIRIDTSAVVPVGSMPSGGSPSVGGR